MKYETLGKIVRFTYRFQIETLFLLVYRHIKRQYFPTWRPETRHWWLSVTKNGVKNNHFQPILGHFVLRIQDGACFAKAAFQNEVIPFPQSMGRQMGAKQPTMGHIASSHTTLWPIWWQKSAMFTSFFTHFVVRIQDGVYGAKLVFQNEVILFPQ